jgi:hypothetical protein
MSPAVQKLQFMIRKADLEAILKDQNIRGVRISFDVDARAGISITVDGVRFKGEEVIPTSESYGVCPIPPDCNEDTE